MACVDLIVAVNSFVDLRNKFESHSTGHCGVEM